MRGKNSKKESAPIKRRSKKLGKDKKNNFDWDSLIKQTQAQGKEKRQRIPRILWTEML